MRADACSSRYLLGWRSIRADVLELHVYSTGQTDEHATGVLNTDQGSLAALSLNASFVKGNVAVIAEWLTHFDGTEGEERAGCSAMRRVVRVGGTLRAVLGYRRVTGRSA